MEFPTKINIFGFEWTISESEDIATEGRVYGSTHFETQRIFIEPNLSEQFKMCVIWHEIMHIMLYYTGLSERMKRKEQMMFTEDELIDPLATALYQFCKDNNLYGERKSKNRKSGKNKRSIKKN